MVAVTTCLFQTDLGSINKFRCPLWHPVFGNPEPAKGHLLVFPREPVTITQSGARPVVANVNLVMLYNQGQEYRRQKISERGDRCDFFRYDATAVAESIHRFDRSVAERWEQPFLFSHANISAELFLKQRRLLKAVEQGQYQSQPNRWNEQALEILDETVIEIFANHGIKPPKISRQAARKRQQLAMDTQRVLCFRYSESFSLEDLANELDTSAFHLCRVFKAQTGITIHEYLTQIRLRVATECIRTDGRDLTNLALDLGFSSHSHFTATFRKVFGMTPSQWRKQVLA